MFDIDSLLRFTEHVAPYVWARAAMVASLAIVSLFFGAIVVFSGDPARRTRARAVLRILIRAMTGSIAITAVRWAVRATGGAVSAFTARRRPGGTGP